MEPRVPHNKTPREDMQALMGLPPLIIRIELKDQYGRQVAYPVCSTAKTFAEIAGTKILTDITLMRIASLGYTIDIKPRKWRMP